MTTSLFDLTTSSQAPLTPSAPPKHSGITRLISTKYGLHREVSGGVLTGREFLLAELEDGRIVRQFPDGTREAAVCVSGGMVESLVKAGAYVEVEG